MLDQVFISTTSGILLFQKDFTATENKSQLRLSASSKSDLNQLIQKHVITGNLSSIKSNSHSVSENGKCFRWALDSQLLIVGVHSVAFSFSYLDSALERIKTEFTKKYKGTGTGGWDEWRWGDIEYRSIELMINLILKTFASVSSSTATSKSPRSFQETEKFAATASGAGKAVPVKDMVAEKVDLILTDAKQRQPRPYQPKNKLKQNDSNNWKKKKEGRTWDASGAATTSSVAPSTLDFSHDQNESIIPYSAENLMGSGFTTDDNGIVSALDISTLGKSPEEKEAGPSILSTLFSSISLTTKPLTREDLDKPLSKIKEHLVGKNVAAPVAAHLSESLTTGLLGQTFSKWGGIDAAIHTNLSQILYKILSPGESTNILHAIAAKKDVYSICFVGVNGVGKSTNLSKIAFWLVQNGLSVLVAACDTFRSGAVEQLKVHERNLNSLCQTGRKVKVFDRGYGKDPAGIAKEALGYAKSEGYDVCLIDTAGRMQDNETLMRALAKLVTLNNPDKIVFVGEALVGNEAVDQLTKFNQALQNFSGVSKPRQIDGIVLSKFDTIDDKVGAVLSMTFVTGKPILFVGTGQTYTDLRRMNVSTIVTTLLKK